MFNPAPNPECFWGKLPKPKYVAAFMQGDLNMRKEERHVPGEQKNEFSGINPQRRQEHQNL
jgi:hypothetical protein